MPTARQLRIREAEIAARRKPAPSDMPWVAQRRMQIGDKIFNRGCRIDTATLQSLPNFAALIDGGHVRQLPASQIADVKPVPLEVSQTTRETKRIVVLADPCIDKVEQWRTSLKLTCEANNCDPATGRDLLCGDHAGAELYKLAARVAAEQHARANNITGRRIAQVI